MKSLAGFQRQVEGVQVTLQNIEKYRTKFRRNLPKIVSKAAKDLRDRMKENAGLADHDLQDLKELGHPYSTKYQGEPLHDPPWFVHTQSGDLQKAIRSKTHKRRNAVTAQVGILNESEAPHAKHVIMGTSCLVSRDFVGETLKAESERIRGEMREDLRKVMRKGSI
jgi:phage-related minor tail protein